MLEAKVVGLGTRQGEGSRRHISSGGLEEAFSGMQGKVCVEFAKRRKGFFANLKGSRWAHARVHSDFLLALVVGNGSGRFISYVLTDNCFWVQVFLQEGRQVRRRMDCMLMAWRTCALI